MSDRRWLVVLIMVFGPISGAHFNPAVTVARSLTDTFAGIRPTDISGFIAAQCVGALATVLVAKTLFKKSA